MRRHLHSAYCILFLLFWSCIVPKNVEARKETLFLDSFDELNRSMWSIVSSYQWMNPAQPCLYHNEEADWAISNGALQIEIAGPGCATEIALGGITFDKAEQYEIAFDLEMPFSTHMDRNYVLRYEDPREYLAVKILDQSIFLEKGHEGSIGGGTMNSSAFYPFRANNTYHFKNILWSDGGVQIFINDQLVIDATDRSPRLQTGSPGFRGSVGAISYSISRFDNLVLSRIAPDQELQVNAFSQHDPHWAGELYGKNQGWDMYRPTISDWGCALTSAAMMLRGIGISSIPEYGELNPSSLNRWLQDQPYGYVGSGLVNWGEIVRLTGIANALWNTPVLEFRSPASTSLSMIQEELQEGNYVIAQHPGHFVLANGVLDDPFTIFSHDPAEIIHRRLNHREVLGARIFTPSHSDLSLLLIAIPEGVSASLFRNGMPVGSTFSDQISTNQGIKTQHWILVSKPEKAEYHLNLESPFPAELVVFKYDNKGTLTTEKISLPAGYHQEAVHVQQSVEIFESMSELVESLWEDHAIPEPRSYLKLRFLADGYDRSIITEPVMKTRITTWMKHRVANLLLPDTSQQTILNWLDSTQITL